MKKIPTLRLEKLPVIALALFTLMTLSCGKDKSDNSNSNTNSDFGPVSLNVKMNDTTVIDMSGSSPMTGNPGVFAQISTASTSNATYPINTFSLTGNKLIDPAAGKSKSIILLLRDITASGTYTLGETNGSFTYTDASAGASSMTIWNAEGTKGEGTVTISKIGGEYTGLGKLCKGSFTIKAVSIQSGTEATFTGTFNGGVK